MESSQSKIEILAGIAVALATVPEALAFSLIAGVPPAVGLYATFVVGLTTSVLGGRPGMISGATGAVAIGLASLTKNHGIEYIFPTVILAGLIQIAIGLLKLDKFVKLVSYPVIVGFLNGLAIIIFGVQLCQFRADVNGHPHWMAGMQLYSMIGLSGLTMLIMFLLPRLSRSIPPAIVAVIIVFVLTHSFGISTKTVGDIAAVHAGIPSFHIPQVSFSFGTLWLILPYSVIMASVGLIESLLTSNMISRVTRTQGDNRRETLAQGAANVLSGLFGGMGGCAMVGQTLVNLSAGGKNRLSGVTASITLLIFIVFGARLIEQIPMAALTGIMMAVAVRTFKGELFKLSGKISFHDLFTAIVVTAIIVFMHNLALAVLTGVVISALLFVWDYGQRGVWVSRSPVPGGILHYKVKGSLFFGSVSTFHEKFDIHNDPGEIVIDFRESRVTDVSGAEAINELVGRYMNAGKKVLIKHLNRENVT